MILRPLEPTDCVEALTTLIHRAYRRLGDAGWNLTGVDQSADTTRERIMEAECWVAVSTTDGSLIGTILVRPPNRAGDCPYFKKEGVAVINQLAVEPSFQGRGVGKRLVEQAERRAVEMGASEIALDTPEPAEELVSWYRKRGYALVDRIAWQGKTYRSVVMAKSLP